MKDSSSSTQSIVKQASKLFYAQQYQQAKTLYQQAGDLLGKHNFALNMQLCDKRLTQSPSAMVTHHPALMKNEQINSRDDATQLKQTQALLEQYFVRSQELEYKLLDK